MTLPINVFDAASPGIAKAIEDAIAAKHKLPYKTVLTRTGENEFTFRLIDADGVSIVEDQIFDKMGVTSTMTIQDIDSPIKIPITLRL